MTTTNNELSKLIDQIAESATLKVDRKAKELRAEGRPIISFAAGEPDFETPSHIVQAAIEAAKTPAFHRYTAAPGLPVLREAIADKTKRDSGWQVEPDQVLVTNGGKQAVYQACATILNPGDEVILPTPYWTSYPESIRLAGGVQKTVFAGAQQDYKPTVEQLESARTAKTKAVIFVSPSNPTGAVFSLEETKAIGEWAADNGIWVIADEIYQNLVYEGPRENAASIAEAAPRILDRCILVNGVAKTYAMTGWRLGWMVGPENAIQNASNLQSHLSSNVSNISQMAGLAALTGDQTPAIQMRKAFNTRRKIIARGLNSIDGVECPIGAGAFYVYPDVTGLLNREWAGTVPKTSLELANLLLEECEIATVPGEAFGRSGYLRFSYALGESELREGLARLNNFFGS